ncbi:hypothetical protein OSTOST_21053, partial [Ostertagia ostertagi]
MCIAPPSHQQAQFLCSGKFFIGNSSFPDICALIEYVREQKPVTNQSGAKLLSPVRKQKWELKHDWIKLDKLLGEGAFGGVYAGTLTTPDFTRKVAVKVHKGRTVSKEQIAEDLQGSANHAALSTPECCQVLRCCCRE